MVNLHLFLNENKPLIAPAENIQVFGKSQHATLTDAPLQHQPWADLKEVTQRGLMSNQMTGLGGGVLPQLSCAIL